ncbi:single-stranded DNA-binding protein [Microbacterium sediminicola]|uniref:Single-stranded DNA-binding protein n=1 Tax=Microbacterium sediminicola TaxID=415210 RepID=A0ABN2HQP0_9MICO
MTDTITVTGNVAATPELRVTPSGVAIVNFRVGSGQRRLDRASGEWVDDGTNWFAVSAFRTLAEHVASSVRKGDPVVVTGRLRIRDWEAGGKRGTDVEITADAVGHNLRWGTSEYSRQVGARPGVAPADDQNESWSAPAVTASAEAETTPF